MKQQLALQTPLNCAGAIETLLGRRLPDGGFPESSGGGYRPDATAWTILCLEAFGAHSEVAAAGRAKLVASQQPDGSIPLSPDYPEAFWPTAAAAMALQGASFCSTEHGKAVAFLLTTTGRHSLKDPESPIGHDSSIPGWPWIGQTHSWVEPTAMAMRALVLAGKSAHERVQSGVRMLLDRQLSAGGWNYGNTTVFGKTLNPMPVATGMALWALAGLAKREQVIFSLNLLVRQLPNLHTPKSLGWALQGLSAWKIAAPDADHLIADCLQRQERYGGYPTSQLGGLLLAAASLQAARKSDA